MSIEYMVIIGVIVFAAIVVIKIRVEEKNINSKFKDKLLRDLEKLLTKTPADYAAEHQARLQEVTESMLDMQEALTSETDPKIINRLQKNIITQQNQIAQLNLWISDPSYDAAVHAAKVADLRRQIDEL